jgi:hypothetical protein
MKNQKILISPGYGTGFSSWHDPAMATDPRLIKAFVTGGQRQLRETTARLYPKACLLGIDQVKIIEIPEDQEFMIIDHDGYERIIC